MVIGNQGPRQVGRNRSTFTGLITILTDGWIRVAVQYRLKLVVT